MPQNVGDEDDDNGGQHAVGEAGEPRVVSGEIHEVDTPAPGEYRCGTDDQQRPQTALEAYHNDAGRILSNLQRTGWLKQVLDCAPDHAVGQRQGDNDEE
jgi:hypothetical protein